MFLLFLRYLSSLVDVMRSVEVIFVLFYRPTLGILTISHHLISTRVNIRNRPLCIGARACVCVSLSAYVHRLDRNQTYQSITSSGRFLRGYNPEYNKKKATLTNCTDLLYYLFFSYNVISLILLLLLSDLQIY